MGYPLPGTVTHSLAHGFRNLLKIAVATDIDFKEADEIKTILSDPEAMARLQATRKGASTEAKPDDAPPADNPDDAADSDGSDSSGGGIGDLFGGMD